MIYHELDGNIFIMDQQDFLAVLNKLVEADYEDVPAWDLQKEGYGGVQLVPNTVKKRLVFTLYAAERVREEYSGILELAEVRDIAKGLQEVGFRHRYSRYFQGNRTAIYITSSEHSGKTSYHVKIRGFHLQPLRDLITSAGETTLLSSSRPRKDADRVPNKDIENNVSESTKASKPTAENVPSDWYWKRPLPELRAAALQAPQSPVVPQQVPRLVYHRRVAVRVYVLRRADGICAGCGAPAPFKTTDGRPYLETHHAQRLADGGHDHPQWVVAICPNCHARAHHAEDAAEFNACLSAIAQVKEKKAE